MDFGSLTTSTQDRFTRNATASRRHPTLSVFIEGQGDMTDYVKSYSFNRVIENTLHDPMPSSGILVLVDLEGEFVDNGQPVFRTNDKIKIWAGFDDDHIPRFSGVIVSSRPISRTKEIEITFQDDGYILDKVIADGNYSDYSTPKLLINNLVSGIKPVPIGNPVWENSAGQPEDFHFGTNLGIAVAGTCTASANATQMTDVSHDFGALGVRVGMAIKNTTDDNSMGIITEMEASGATPAATIHFADGLHGGADNYFDVNDNYKIYDGLQINSRSYWSCIKGATLCINYVYYFDEAGQLQCKRRESFTDVDVTFTDADIIDIDYIDRAELINAKTLDFAKSVKVSDGLTIGDMAMVGQNYRTVERQESVDRYGEYANYEVDELVDNYKNAGTIIEQILDWFAYPRYFINVVVPARPQLQIMDRISIKSLKRNIEGKFTIFGIGESMSAGAYVNEFILLSSSERF